MDTTLRAGFLPRVLCGRLDKHNNHNNINTAIVQYSNLLASSAIRHMHGQCNGRDTGKAELP